MKRAADSRSRSGCPPSPQQGNNTSADIPPQAAHPIRCSKVLGTNHAMRNVGSTLVPAHIIQIRTIRVCYTRTPVRPSGAPHRQGSALRTSPPNWPPQTTLPPSVTVWKSIDQNMITGRRAANAWARRHDRPVAPGACCLCCCCYWNACTLKSLSMASAPVVNTGRSSRL